MNFRDGNAVRRFHTVNLLVGETVGHHSANVALLCDVLSGYNASPNLFRAALHHDLAEQYTGDVPATAKWQWPKLKEILEEIEIDSTPSITLTPMERRILKQADMLDLCFKMREEINMGNAAMGRILNNGVKWLLDNDPLPTTRALIGELIDG